MAYRKELMMAAIDANATENMHFVLDVENAFDIAGRGTVLAGYLYGKVRTGSSVGAFVDPDTMQPVTDDLPVLGLERYKKIEERLDSGTELIGCGILVPTQPDPAAWVGKLFCGGYRVPRTPELAAYGNEMRAYNTRFALFVKEAFDLGAEGTGLVGYMAGNMVAGLHKGFIYDRGSMTRVSSQLRVKALTYRGKDEDGLMALDGFIPCGVVVDGHFAPADVVGKVFAE